MYIEELILDGFKSYAKRTVVSGWDREFNAITGLNGSGKSNILDAICFVLGIENLRHVRATNLQDLVYKRGQAGITKATVTIVFNNDDPATSPIGFTEFKQITVTRQIVIGGKNKYLINGHVAQQKSVENLFQSVQLNVNNPHFLIMQGKITKVLNMKPPEILAMVEETAGTRMFEDRKEKALSTISKKGRKLEEISSLLDEVITPKLDKLREERAAFLEYQKTETEVDRLRRLVVAYEYHKNQEKLATIQSEFQTKKDHLQGMEETLGLIISDMSSIQNSIKEIEEKKRLEMTKGGRFQELEKKVNQLSNELVRLKTVLDLHAESIKDEKEQLSKLENQLQASTNLQGMKEKELVSLYDKFQKTRFDHEQEALKLKKDEELLSSLTTGMSSTEGNESGFMEQMKDAKDQIQKAKTMNEECKFKVKHLQSELKDLTPKAKAAEKEQKHLVDAFKTATMKAEKLEIKVKEMTVKDNDVNSAQKRLNASESSIKQIQEKVDELSSQLSQFPFRFSDPSPNFDRKQVKGFVANLIQLQPDQLDYANALEVTAGGKLYNVVVDTEKVASQLLEKGKLQRRVTIIPLNKISRNTVSKERIEAAKAIAPGKVDVALSFVGFEKAIDAAMQYVFGSTLICWDKESANSVTFNKDVRMKSVTLDGDVYDPSGTLTGGSKPTTGSILKKLHDLSNLQQTLAEAKKAHATLLKDTKALEDSLNARKQLEQDLDMAHHERKLLEKQLDSNSQTQIIKKVADMNKQLIQANDDMKNAKQIEDAAKAECKRLEKEIEEFSTNKDSKLNSLKKSIASQRKDIVAGEKAMQDSQIQVETHEMEIKQIKEEIKQTEEAIFGCMDSVKKLEAEYDAIDGDLLAIKSQYDQENGMWEEEKKQLVIFDKDLKRLEKERKSKSKRLEDGQIEVQKLKLELERMAKEQSCAESILAEISKNYDWIEDQKSLFGRVNGPFDFQSINVGDLKRKLKSVEEQHVTLRKTINTKVMDMIDSVEKRENLLKDNLLTVKKDKKKIEDTIHKLDNYKRDALIKTWERVNVDFGAIFGELLPGNTAKLEPPEGQDITQGLEVKVCLGEVWKQSLTELSGGQRSLIALSLILALLQYKPAPMYILDEVDAALDLSHTQNIGTLFRNRFKGSQFIVVSLKEGMFNNANVLFRTKFRDGLSYVDRHANPNVVANRPRSGVKTSAISRVGGGKRSAVASGLVH